VRYVLCAVCCAFVFTLAAISASSSFPSGDSKVNCSEGQDEVSRGDVTRATRVRILGTGYGKLLLHIACLRSSSSGAWGVHGVHAVHWDPREGEPARLDNRQPTTLDRNRYCLDTGTPIHAPYHDLDSPWYASSTVPNLHHSPRDGPVPSHATCRPALGPTTSQWRGSARYSPSSRN
jgi:hypothetical protein